MLNRKTFVLLLAYFCHAAYANYTINVLLMEFNAGLGYLLNGTHCNAFWNVNQRCDIKLKVGIQIDSSATSCNTLLDLGNVTQNSNSITFQQQTYGAWVNPYLFVYNGEAASYQGFRLCVLATEARDNAVIDSFNTDFIDANRINDFEYFTHSRGLLDPTLLSFAWQVSGNTSVVQPTPPTTTTTTVITSSPAPVAHDCQDAYDNDPELTSSQSVEITIGNEPVEVYCIYNPRGKTAATVIQSRGNSTDQNAVLLDSGATISDYNKPLGTPGSDNTFWLGLDNMNALTTSNNYSLRIITCCGNTLVLNQDYSNFLIGNSTTGYKLQANSAIAQGLNGSQFTDINQKFSLNENGSYYNSAPWPLSYCYSAHTQNDSNPQVTGWWFGSCGNNLNGFYYALDSDDINKTTCQLLANPPPNGYGVELLSDSTVSGNFGFTAGISYTRVAMAVYRSDGTLSSTQVNEFCTT